MCLRCGQSRAFFFTLDAVLSFLIIISFSGVLLFTLDQKNSLDSECLYQLSQDVMEVCSKKADFSEGCFGLLEELSGAHYSLSVDGMRIAGKEHGGTSMARRYGGHVIELIVWT